MLATSGCGSLPSASIPFQIVVKTLPIPCVDPKEFDTKLLSELVELILFIVEVKLLLLMLMLLLLLIGGVSASLAVPKERKKGK